MAGSEICGRFKQLEGLKGDLHQRCEDYASWTIQNLFPLDSTDNSTEDTRDYQSVGARAVNHLANKIVLVMFPAGRPFFRIDPSDELKVLFKEAGLGDTEIESALAKVERESPKTLQKLGARTVLVRVMKELIALGNAALYYDETGKRLHSYHLRNYVVQRDLSGNILDAIFRDQVAFGTLPAEIQDKYKSVGSNKRIQPDANVTLYTRVQRNPRTSKYDVTQAVDDVDIDGVSGSYPADDLPWVVLTWELTRGKDYGTGLVEEYAGDFTSLSTLSESLTLGAAIAADIKFLVDPGGQTDAKDLNDAETGAFVYGRRDDINALVSDKVADFQFVQAVVSAIEKRLGLAFLLNSAVTRDAERVTAEEIRMQAQELEGSLGGVYSRLAEELQLPLARVVVTAGKHELPLEGLELFILTGMESLSRTTELEQVLGFINDVAALAQIPPEALGRLKLSDVMNILADGRSLDKTKFVKDEEQYQQEVQAQQEALAQQRMQEQAVQSAGAIAENQSKG